jgi:hypothetical protein
MSGFVFSLMLFHFYFIVFWLPHAHLESHRRYIQVTTPFWISFLWVVVVIWIAITQLLLLRGETPLDAVASSQQV